MRGTVLFGLLALIFDMLAVGLLVEKRAIGATAVSVMAGIASLVSSAVSAHHWVIVLKASGKSTQWLGAERYPIPVALLAIVAAAGLVSAVVGAIRIVKRSGT